MSNKTSRIDINDLVSINVNNYKKIVWLHIRRKDKSVSLTAKDFSTLIKKSGEIKRLIEKHGRGKKKISKQIDTEPESTDDTDSE